MRPSTPRTLPSAALSLLLLLAAASPHVQAQAVTFEEVNDALASRCYDAKLTSPDPSRINHLQIGIQAGQGAVSSPQGTAVQLQRGCVAGLAAFHPRSTFDTISFQIQAPSGYHVAKVTFRQMGTVESGRGGQTAMGATWVVDGRAAEIPYSAPDKQWEASADLSGRARTRVSVSISTFLSVAGTGVSTATARVAEPVVVVELQKAP